MGRESLLGLATHEQTHELVGGRKTKKKKRTFSLYICKSTGRWEIRWETSRCDLLLEIWANDGHQMLLIALSVFVHFHVTIDAQAGACESQSHGGTAFVAQWISPCSYFPLLTAANHATVRRNEHTIG